MQADGYVNDLYVKDWTPGKLHARHFQSTVFQSCVDHHVGKQ